MRRGTAHSTLITFGTAVAALLLTAFALPGTPASAATPPAATAAAAADSEPGCGSACDNQNPETYRLRDGNCMQCWHTCASDATTVSTQSSAGHVEIELRYSPSCRTFWARRVYTVVHSTKLVMYDKKTGGKELAAASGDAYTMMLNGKGRWGEAQAWYGPSGLITPRKKG